MMHYLAEDPTYLAGGLGVVGLGFLVALKVTQQGKYLVRALVAFGLALVVVGIERAWVTDNERIEAVVYGLADAVEHSDADRAADYLADDVLIDVNPGAVEGGVVARYMVAALSRLQGQKMTRELLRTFLSRYEFDFINVSQLTTNVGAQSRRGTATFRAYASGMQLATAEGGARGVATPPAGTDWSLGLRETAPGVWKVDRISPTHLDRSSFGGADGPRRRMRISGG